MTTTLLKFLLSRRAGIRWNSLPGALFARYAQLVTRPLLTASQQALSIAGRERLQPTNCSANSLRGPIDGRTIRPTRQSALHRLMDQAPATAPSARRKP